MADTTGGAAMESRNGRVVTFYSFKGGTGRSMAVANVAWILAANGHRVLVADWDLESPGLHRFFQPFLHEQELWNGAGVIDLVRDYERVAKKSDEAAREGLIARLSRVQKYAFSLDWEFPGGGSLDFLAAGKMNGDFAAALSALDWDNFYHELNGGEFLDALRADLKWNYDYALIDSRTGHSDIADICTVHLPDVLVDCFTLSTQGIEGAAQVAGQIKQRYPGIRLLPVPMRVDQAEKEKVDVGRLVAIQQFPGLPVGMSEAQRREYWASVEVPYQAFYAYEETLAVFGDPPGLPGSLLASFERLTAQITEHAVTGLPPMDEQLRERTKQQFTRSALRPGELIVINYLAEDQVWAEWIAAVLQDASIEVRLRRLDAEGAGETAEPEARNSRSSRSLIVVSAAYLAQRRRFSRWAVKPELAAYVTPSPSLAELSSEAWVSLSGVPENEAVERLRGLFGLTARATRSAPLRGSAIAGMRYPGREPLIFEVPVRNNQFTGRLDDLDRLREQLHDYGPGSFPPVVLQGLGGVGKTQVALEYVHRFKNDYDVIWWFQISDAAFLDAALLDLGASLREELGLNVQSTVSKAETRQVLNVLNRGEVRWLIVYDNADDIDVVRPLMPSGGGHVLITSTNRAWTEQGARPIQVDVFTREESVAHLSRRVPSIAREEAEQIAIAVGDLPLAVATAGAWLAETSYTVSAYLEELARQPRRTLSVSRVADYPEPVSKAWDVSLNRLRERSPAAARLFELCSVMAPQISLNHFLYTDTVARLLRRLEPTLSDRMVIGRLVNEINKLALIKLDSAAGQMIVHLLVQEVVRARMSPEELAEAQHAVQSILVAARPLEDVDDSTTWDSYRLIWPHLEPSQAVSSDEEAARQLFIDRLRYMGIRGDPDRARHIATEAEARWVEMEAAATDRATKETLRRQLLQLRFNLANALREQGHLAEARALNEAVFAEQTSLLGEEHPQTLMTAGSLAADLRAAGQYHEALQLDLKTYPAWTSMYGEDHRRTLSAANNLAVSLRLTGDGAAALRLDVETFDRRRTTLGEEDLWTQSSNRSIVRDLIEVGEYVNAAARMEGMYQAVAKEFGADSQSALDTQVLLGVTLRTVGRAAEAEEPFHAAYQILTAKTGTASAEALACRLSRATNLLSLDKFQEAAAEIERVLQEYKQLRGPAHPHTLACQVNLAAALRATGERDRALDIIRGAAHGLAEMLGEEHPYTLAAMTVWGVLLADQGRLAEAEELETRTTDLLDRKLGEAHPDTLRSRANLLLTRQELGDAAAAAEREAVIGQLARLIGENHPSVVTLRGERRLMRSLDPQPF